MDENWLRTFNGTPGLRELRVEYETRVGKRAEMMPIIQRNKRWKLPVRREGGDVNDWAGYLSAEKTELGEWKWNGTSKLGGCEWEHLKGKQEVEYVVVTDTWIFVEKQGVTPEELGREAAGVEWRELGEDEDEDEDMTEEEEGEDEDEEGTSEYEDRDSEGDGGSQENADEAARAQAV